jgi:hypothetical protein
MKKILCLISTILMLQLLLLGCSSFKSPGEITGQEKIKPTNTPGAQELKIMINQKGVHPVSNGYAVLGGIVDGEWLNETDITPKLSSGVKLRIFSESKLLGEANVSKVEPARSVGQSDVSRFVFDEDVYFEDNRFAITGDWNPFPRPIIIETTNKKKYEGAVKDLLEKTGYYNMGLLEPEEYTPKDTVVRDVRRADFNGDGSEDAIVIASNITEKQIESRANGNQDSSIGLYSVVIFISDLNGLAINQVVSQRFNSCVTHEISFIADIDGDAQMEFVLNSNSMDTLPVEGVAFWDSTLYKIEKGNVVIKSNLDFYPS